MDYLDTNDLFMDYLDTIMVYMSSKYEYIFIVILRFNGLTKMCIFYYSSIEINCSSNEKKFIIDGPTIDVRRPVHHGMD